MFESTIHLQENSTLYRQCTCPLRWKALCYYWEGDIGDVCRRGMCRHASSLPLTPESERYQSLQCRCIVCLEYYFLRCLLRPPTHLTQKCSPVHKINTIELKLWWILKGGTWCHQYSGIIEPKRQANMVARGLGERSNSYFLSLSLQGKKATLCWCIAFPYIGYVKFIWKTNISLLSIRIPMRKLFLICKDFCEKFHLWL